MSKPLKYLISVKLYEIKRLKNIVKYFLTQYIISMEN